MTDLTSAVERLTRLVGNVADELDALETADNAAILREDLRLVLSALSERMSLTREEIARVIDGSSFAEHPAPINTSGADYGQRRRRREIALAKAVQILSLLSASPPSPSLEKPDHA